jgi:hypothetical protein
MVAHLLHSLRFLSKPTTPDFGVWVKDPQEGTFLVHGTTLKHSKQSHYILTDNMVLF